MQNIFIPDHDDIEKTVKSLFSVMFPLDDLFNISDPDINTRYIRRHIFKVLAGLTDNPDQTTRNLIGELKQIKKTLISDAGFILESDPAANHLIEVIAVYPGFYAIFCYRIAHFLIKASVPVLPRMITEYAHKMTGIDIHPSATIGSPFSIDHGTGIVIGETTIIGNYVKLYQGVTLGALSVEKNKAAKKRHPTIEDNVILYAGSTILGGNTIIGNHSIIGGNVWLTESLEPYSVVYNKNDVIVHNHNDIKGQINFVI